MHGKVVGASHLHDLFNQLRIEVNTNTDERRKELHTTAGQGYDQQAGTERGPRRVVLYPVACARLDHVLEAVQVRVRGLSIGQKHYTILVCVCTRVRYGLAIVV